MILLPTFLVIITFSVIGYGIIYSYICDKEYLNQNIGVIGLVGCFFLIFISYLTNIFLSHNYLHNIVLLTVGLLTFITHFYLKKGYKNFFKKQKISLLIFIALLIGIFLHKSHDDFPYYHLPYTVNLVENKLLYGLGNFNHGFRTPSSLFYLNSVFYLPIINYFSFHYGAFIIMFFSNIILVLNIIKISKNNFIKFLSLFFFIFINIVFYRFAEHGTDRSGQIIVLLLTIYSLKIINEKKLNNFDLSFILLLLAIIFTLKTYFLIYIIILIPIYFKFKSQLKIKKLFYNKQMFILILTGIFVLHVNFANTGCLIYPIKKLCFSKFSWAMSEHEINRMSKHFEVWSKAGHTPNSRVENPEEYIKGINWVGGWLENYFFNKVSDTLLGTIAIIFVVYLFFLKNKWISTKEIKFSYLNLYIPIFVIFLYWFFYHPALRYGGFCLLAILMFMPISNFLSKKKLNISDNRKFVILIIIGLLIFNVRNINRIEKEITIYNYNILDNAYYFLPKESYKEVQLEENIILNKPVRGGCWDIKSPCTHRPAIEVKKKFNYLIYFNTEK
tara:strand:+ start:49736 stop:51409 length:1674 start_codon:yes stop_codon:yes gene_type:complete